LLYFVYCGYFFTFASFNLHLCASALQCDFLLSIKKCKVFSYLHCQVSCYVHFFVFNIKSCHVKMKFGPVETILLDAAVLLTL